MIARAEKGGDRLKGMSAFSGWVRNRFGASPCSGPGYTSSEQAPSAWCLLQIKPNIDICLTLSAFKGNFALTRTGARACSELAKSSFFLEPVFLARARA